MSKVFDFPLSTGCREHLCGEMHPCGKEEGHTGTCYCLVCDKDVSKERSGS